MAVNVSIINCCAHMLVSKPLLKLSTLYVDSTIIRVSGPIVNVCTLVIACVSYCVKHLVKNQAVQPVNSDQKAASASALLQLFTLYFEPVLDTGQVTSSSCCHFLVFLGSKNIFLMIYLTPAFSGLLSRHFLFCKGEENSRKLWV